jgi:hypothetical protein
MGDGWRGVFSADVDAALASIEGVSAGVIALHGGRAAVIMDYGDPELLKIVPAVRRGARAVSASGIITWSALARKVDLESSRRLEHAAAFASEVGPFDAQSSCSGGR